MSSYEKRVQAHIHAKIGNSDKIVTIKDYDNPENVKAFADQHDNKKGSFGSCPAFDISLVADFIEETDSGKPNQWPQIRAVVFRDTRIWQQLEKLMEGYANAKLPHPRIVEASKCFTNINKKKTRPNDNRSKSINQSLTSLW